MFDICHSALSICLFMYRNHPSAPLKVPVSLLSCVLEVPKFTSLMSVSPAHFLYPLSHSPGRIIASPPSHTFNRSLSILLPDLIMSVVRELVASLESHGRQLHSEVGHMVRWVTRADSNTPRDGQRDQAAVSTLHNMQTRTGDCVKSQQ